MNTNLMSTIFEAFSFSFFNRALLMGSVLAVVIALMGTFVVIRKEAIIGHTIANTLFAGIAIGLLLDIDLNLATIVAGILAALFITWLQKVRRFSRDSLLEFVSQLSMALAIFFISFIQGYQTNLLQFLFGDILAISNNDVIVGSILAALILIVVLVFKRKLLQVTLSPELATASGTNVGFYNFLLTLLVVFTIAIGVKIIGVILLSAFLVIPPNIGKLLARNFNQMIISSMVVGLIGTILGLFGAYIFNVPSGAMIILVLSFILVSTTIYSVAFTNK